MAKKKKQRTATREELALQAELDEARSIVREVTTALQEARDEVAELSDAAHWRDRFKTLESEAQAARDEWRSYTRGIEAEIRVLREENADIKAGKLNRRLADYKKRIRDLQLVVSRYKVENQMLRDGLPVRLTQPNFRIERRPPGGET